MQGAGAYREFVRVLRLQLAAIGFLSAGAFLWKGQETALSCLAGGLIAWLPNAAAALLIVLCAGRGPKRALGAVYGGEALKLALTFVLFALAFQSPRLRALPLLFGFIAGLAAPWIALVTGDSNIRERTRNGD